MKNKIKLIILIIPLILLSSGCTATYTLNITKDKIEETMQYPGTIKVVVIRETRAEEVAK